MATATRKKASKKKKIVLTKATASEILAGVGATAADNRHAKRYLSAANSKSRAKS
jgi:hypothetical protein